MAAPIQGYNSSLKFNGTNLPFKSLNVKIAYDQDDITTNADAGAKHPINTTSSVSGSGEFVWDTALVTTGNPIFPTSRSEVEFIVRLSTNADTAGSTITFDGIVKDVEFTIVSEKVIVGKFNYESVGNYTHVKGTNE